jgi:hypothetical protein
MIFGVGHIPKGTRLGAPAGRGRRMAEREPAVAPAGARLLMDEHDTAGLACTVVDVSRYGCKIALSERGAERALRKAGAECILELDGEVWLRVRICWFANEVRGLKIIRKLVRK